MTYTPTNAVIDIAGNIFVDQGMLTLKVLLEKSVRESLVVQDVIDLKTSPDEQGITWIANNLDRFKSYSMIYTKNHIRFNSATKDRTVRIAEFQEFMNSLVDGVVDEYNPDLEKGSKCNICGHPYAYDFDAKLRTIISKHSLPKKVPEKMATKKTSEKKAKVEPKYSCREFFPLAGTMGQESQAFPNMSKCLSICPRCLLFVYFLPFSTQIIEGNMAIFQISDNLLQYKMVKIIVDKYINNIRTDTADSEIRNVGKDFKSKNELVFENFGVLFHNTLPEKPTKEDFARNFPSSRLACWLWKYVNSGQNASLSYEAIPNNAVNFLYLTSCFDMSQSLLDLVHQELKDIKYPPKQIFNSIRHKELYQFEKLDASTFELDHRLAILYYYFILSYSREAILAAVRIASKLPRYNPAEIDRKFRNRFPILVNQCCREMVEKGELSLEEYQFIFSLVPKSIRSRLGLSIIYQIWSLNITNEDLNAFDQQLSDMFQEDQRVVIDYSKPLTMQLNDVERKALGIASQLFDYFKSKSVKDQDIKTNLIDKKLKQASISWFSTVIAHSILSTKKNLPVVDYFFLLDSMGSWFLIRSLLRTLFTAFISRKELTTFTVNDTISIPLEYSKKIQNPVIEHVLGDYLDYRISRQGKGFPYMMRNFIDPILKGKIRANIIYNFLYEHAQDRNEVGELDKIKYNLTDWPEMTISPETGQQDDLHFIQYVKIFLANYAVTYLANVVEHEETYETLSKEEDALVITESESNVEELIEYEEEQGQEEAQGEEEAESLLLIEGSTDEIEETEFEEEVEEENETETDED